MINKIDLYLSFLIFVTGAVIILLSYFKGIGQFGMGFAIVLAPVIYMICLKKIAQEKTTCDAGFGTLQEKSKMLIFNSIFFALFTLSIILLYFSDYSRPIAYYLVISCTFTILLLELLICKVTEKSWFYLSKVLILSISLRAGRFFSFPVIPGTDTHDHLLYSHVIQETGYLPSYEIALKYTFTPVWHILETINQVFLNVDPKLTLFFTNSIIFLIIISIFIFLIVRNLTNVKTAMISVLLLNTADMISVLMLTNINPGIIVLVIVSIVTYVILKNTGKTSKIFEAFIFIFVVLSILTHQLTTFIFFLIIWIAYLNNKIIANFCLINSHELPYKKYIISGTILIFFTVILIFYWQLIGANLEDSSFFGGMIERMDRTIGSLISNYVSDDTISVTTYEKLFSKNDPLTNTLFSLGSNFLLFFGIVGILASLNIKEWDPRRFFLSSVIFVMFVLVYPGTYIGLNQVLIPHRFLPFLEFFITIFAALSIYWIGVIVARTSIVTRTFFYLILFCLIFFLISTPYINQNDPVYCQEITYRTELKTSEIQSIIWSVSKSGEHIAVVDDLISRLQVSTITGYTISEQSLTNYGSMENKFRSYQSPIIIRDEIKKTGTVQRSGSFGKTKAFDYRNLFTEVQKNSDKIFMSDGTEVFI